MEVLLDALTTSASHDDPLLQTQTRLADDLPYFHFNLPRQYSFPTNAPDRIS